MTFDWYERGEWSKEEKARPPHEFLSMYIWRAMILKGTMGFCLSMVNLAAVIRCGIEEYEVYKAGKKWHTRYC